MIPHSITDAGLVFIARGRPYSVAKDHLRFDRIREMLTEPDHTADGIADALDWVGALDRISGGRIHSHDGRFHLDDEYLPDVWTACLADDPACARILLVRVGDLIRVEGDEDCPDGTYPILGKDLTDVDRTLYVEVQDAGYYGYPANDCVKEWIPHSLNHDTEVV